MKLLFRWLFLFMFGISSAQQITLDTSLVSDEPNTVEQYWYWSGGFPVLGSGFTPNSTITVFDTDANGERWRDFTGTSDAQGNFSVQISAKMIRSLLGAHTITAKDDAGIVATSVLNVIANIKEVIQASVSSPILTQSQFANIGFKLKAQGFAPNVLVNIHIFSPFEVGSQITPSVEKRADENGNYEIDINQFIQSYPWGDTMPDTPGTWRIVAQDENGGSHYGQVNFRVLPDNPSPDNYCTISQQADYIPVSAISSFEIVGVDSNTSPAGSTTYYEDFTSKTFNLTAGQTYTVKLKGKNSTGYLPDTYTMFMDWNQNGILDDENEIVSEGYIFGSTGEDDKFTEFTFTVPQNVMNGNTRLRILKIQAATAYSMFWPTGACGTYFKSGQVEDYTLNIAGGISDPGCSFSCPEDINVDALVGEETAIVNYDLSFSCPPGEATTCNIDYPSNGFETTLNASNYNIVANDFDVPEGATLNITKFIPNLVRYSYGASISFYKNNNGAPGELIQAFSNLSYESQTQIGTNSAGDPIYEVTIKLPTSLELTSGKYWVSINAQGPLVSWESKTNGNTLNSYTSTNNGQTWIVKNSFDGVFKIGYDCTETPTSEVVLVQGLASGSTFPLGNTIVVHNLVYNGVVIDTCVFDVNVNETLNTQDVSKKGLEVYPNPVTDILKISHTKTIKDVLIYDMTGKLVYSKNINSKNAELNISKLSAGIYILNAMIDGKSESFKILKK